MDMDTQIRVLVVEDELMAAEALQDCLTSRGFLTILANDGIAALELAARSDFDVLLTDLRMPRMTGTVLIRKLRADRPSLPVVVMTGQPPLSWQSDLQRPGEGRLVLLHKPVNLRTIVNALLSVVADTRLDIIGAGTPAPAGAAAAPTPKAY